MQTLTDAQLAAAAIAGGFNTKQLQTIAVAVALAESSGDPAAINPKYGTYGLWQIYKKMHPDIWNDNWQDPTTNARMAYAVYRKQGWSAWSTFTSGAYLRYYPRAAKAVGNPATSPGSVTSQPAIANPLDPFKQLAGTVQTIMDPKLWIRIGLFLAGGILVIVGLFKLTGNNRIEPSTKAFVANAAKAVAVA